MPIVARTRLRGARCGVGGARGHRQSELRRSPMAESGCHRPAREFRAGECPRPVVDRDGGRGRHPGDGSGFGRRAGGVSAVEPGGRRPRRSCGRSTRDADRGRSAGRWRGLCAHAVWSVDREQAAANIRTMDDVFDAELLNRNTQVTLVGAFAAARAGDGGDRTLRRAGLCRGPAGAGDRGARGARGRACAPSSSRRCAAPWGSSPPGSRLGLAVAVGVSRALQSWLFGVGPVGPADADWHGGAARGRWPWLASAIPAARGASVDPVPRLAR